MIKNTTLEDFKGREIDWQQMIASGFRIKEATLKRLSPSQNKGEDTGANCLR